MASKIAVMGDQFKSYMPTTNDISMFVAPVSEPEMKKLIMQLNDGAPGRDGITAKGLKCITGHIAMPLTRLANLSFAQGVFPRYLKVAKMQNKAVRLIAGVTPRPTTDPLYSALNIMPLKSLYMYVIGLFMYKFSNEMLPELFANMFIHVDEVHSYNTRNSANSHLYTSFHHSIELGVGKNV